MGSPKTKDVKRLFALSGNQCAMPGCQTPIYGPNSTATGEICHIKAARPGGARYDSAQSEGERHGFDNLILLCRHHHAVVDDDVKNYPVEALQSIKAIHEQYAGAPNVPDAREAVAVLLDNWSVTINHNSGNIAIGSPGAVQAQTINMRTIKKSISVEPPTGTIGADGLRAGYIQYLINRYNKFASQQPGRCRKFSYGAIGDNLRTKFGTNWKLLSIERFHDVVAELHRRIDRTKVARINKGKDQKSYSTFPEFIRKHR